VEAEKENVDDRCESDISGIATDDSDLSSMSCGAGITMETGNVVYRHQPDPVFNTLLTCCTVLMLCFAIGIGVGHYFGQSLLSTTLIDQVTLCCTASLKRESLEILSFFGHVSGCLNPEKCALILLEEHSAWKNPAQTRCVAKPSVSPPSADSSMLTKLLASASN